MRLTLKKFLKEQNADEMIYVGTSSGSGYIFIETAGYLLDHLDKLDEKLKNDAKATIQRSQHTIDTKLISLAKSSEVLNNGEEISQEKLKRLIKYHENLERTYANAVILRNKKRTELAKWNPLDNRTVLEKYKHTTEPIGTCVIIVGAETGKWFVNK